MPVKFRDYYEALGVPKTATPDEIKSAFRKLARKYHPDTADDKKTAEEKFKEINEAYEVLGDPEKRRKYDDFGANWEHADAMAGAGGRHAGGSGGAYAGGFPRGAGGTDFGDGVEFEFGGTGFSDFFEQLFGARRAAHGPGGGFTNFPQKGSDIEADIMVTIEEAFQGSTRQISFRRSGSTAVQTYTVKIPKGVRDGQRIRLAGQGGHGAGGGESGDLYLRVRFQKHPDYEVVGENLILELDVPAWKCVLGGEAEVATLDGRVRLRVPAGTQNGKKLRMAGKGLPNKSGGRGDLIVVISAQLPTELTPAEREIWQRLSELA